MVDRDSEPEHWGMGKLERAQFAISNLWDDFGQTDSPLFGFVVNAGLASIGIVLWAFTTGWLSFAGGVWAIINLLGIVAWVFNL